MKKRIAIAALALIVAVTGVATAGPARRHTMEGFVLGAGIALLGTAIIHGMAEPEPVVVHHHPPRHEPPGRGHWETRRVWMEPVTETRWNPGHYDRHGRWVQGRYEQVIVSDGYWSTQQIWVSTCRR